MSLSSWRTRSRSPPTGTVTLGDDVVQFLQIEHEDDLAVLLILRVEGGKVIANLNGPLAINSSRMLGVQAVLDGA